MNFLKFFEQHFAGQGPDSGRTEHRVRVAAAALMIEVVRGDDEFSEVERDAVLDSIQRKFDLDAGEAEELLAQAETAARDAHDYYQFTTKINDSFTEEQKLRLIEELWRVAYADETLHRHEEHLIRRVADLLYLRHSDYIRAKLRVQGD